MSTLSRRSFLASAAASVLAAHAVPPDARQPDPPPAEAPAPGGPPAPAVVFDDLPPFAYSAPTFRPGGGVTFRTVRGPAEAVRTLMARRHAEVAEVEVPPHGYGPPAVLVLKGARVTGFSAVAFDGAHCVVFDMELACEDEFWAYWMKFGPGAAPELVVGPR